jgi:hypothetical protein
MHWDTARASRAAWAKLKNSPPTGIQEEFNNIKYLAVDHRSSYGSGWQSLTLHGEKPHWTEAIDQYPGYKHIKDWEHEYHWTEIAERCPLTVEYIKSLPFSKLHRVRFMLLRPGGLIDYHRDNSNMTLSPLNISFNMPEGCEFNIYDQESSEPIKTIPFTDNSAFLVNIGHYHRVINRSNEDRLHMIVHGRYINDFHNNPTNYVEGIDPEFKDLLQ